MPLKRSLGPHSRHPVADPGLCEYVGGMVGAVAQLAHRGAQGPQAAAASFAPHPFHQPRDVSHLPSR